MAERLETTICKNIVEFSLSEIDKRYIQELRFEELISKGHESALNEDVKILKITDSDAAILGNIFEWIKNENTGMNIYINLFIVIIELHQKTDLDILNINFDIPKAFIVEVSLAGEKSKVYYKNEMDVKLQQLINLSNNKKTCEKIECELCYFCDALEKADGSLLKVKIAKESILKHFEDSSMTHKSVCLLFLRIIINCGDEHTQKTLLIDSLKFRGNRNLLAASDLPLIDSITNFSVPKELKQLITSVEENEKNLLMIAVERNNVDSVEFLIRCEFDLTKTIKVHEDDKTAADTAWEKKHYKCLAILIKADSPFPKRFNRNFVEKNSSLEEAVDARYSFTEAVKKGDKAAIKSLLGQFYVVKNVYDFRNVPVLAIALQEKQLETYSYLKHLGFQISNQLEVELFETLSTEEKTQIRDLNRNYFRTSEHSHILYLISKSSPGFDVEALEEKTETIGNMFLKLSDSIELMLKAVQNVDISITFDFQRSHVMVLDPTMNIDTRGYAYYRKGHIYISAANYRENFFDVISVLAHELTHYAMYVGFRNNCRPYNLNDLNRREAFSTICDDLHKYCLNHPQLVDNIISSVYSCYEKDSWHAELIARVPQLKVRYMNDEEKLKKIKETYCRELFDFYETVKSKVFSNSRLFREKENIAEINNLSGLLSKISAANIKFLKKNDELESFLKHPSQQIKVLWSNDSLLTMSMIYQQLGLQLLDDIECVHIFVKSKRMDNSEFSKKVSKVFNSSSKSNLYILCENRNETNNLVEELQHAGSRITIVLRTSGKSKIKISTTETEIGIAHVFCDLVEETQKKFLESKIEFRGKAIKFNQLISTGSSACSYLPLHKLTYSQICKKSPCIVIPNVIKKEVNYIKRDFIKQEEKELKYGESEDYEKNLVPLNQEELMSYAEERKVVIITDNPGTGKSVTITDIAEQMQRKFFTHWVQLIDLRKLAKKLEEKPTNKYKDFSSFLLKTLFKPSDSLEHEIFKELFKDGKVTVLFDCFDELSPEARDGLFFTFKLFNMTINLGNKLWITTRSHLRNDLKSNFSNPLVVCFSPLSENDQIKLLDKYNISQKKSKILLKTLKRDLSPGKSDIIGVPLLIKMLSEALHNKNIQSMVFLNYNLLYESFVRKKIEIWMENSKQSAQKALTDNAMKVTEALQNVAFGYIKSDYKVHCVEWSHERLAEVGLIDEYGRFIHETFADYFIYKSICEFFEHESQKTRIPKIYVQTLLSKNRKIARFFLNKEFSQVQIPSQNVIQSLKVEIESGGHYAILLLLLEERLDKCLEFLLSIVDQFTLSLKNRIFSQTVNSRCISLPESNETEEPLLRRELKIDGSNILHLATRFNNENVCKLIFTHAYKVLTIEELKDLYFGSNGDKENILHCAAWNFKNKNIFEIVYSELRKLLENELSDALKKLLMQKDVYGNDILQAMVYRNSIASFITVFSMIENELSSEAQKQIIDEKDSKGRSAFCVLAMKNQKNEALNIYWQFVQNIYKLPFEQHKFLAERDKKGRDVFQLTIQRNDEKAVKRLFDIIEDFSLHEKKALLSNVDENGENVFHCAAWNYRYSKNVFSLLFKTMRSIFTDIEMKQLFLQQTKNFCLNVFQTFLCKSNFSTLEIFFEAFDLLFQKEEKVLFFIEKETIYEKSILSSLAYFNRKKPLLCQKKPIEQILTLFWSNAKKNFDTEQQLKDLLKSKNKDGSSHALHFAAERNTELFVEELCNIITKHLNDDERKIFFTETDKNGETIFHRAVWSVKRGKMTKMWKHLEKNLNKVEQKEFLKQKDTKKGESVLTKLLVKGNNQVLEEYLEIFNNVFRKKLMRSKILLEKDDSTNRNLMQVTVASPECNVEVLKVLWKLIKRNFEINDQKEALFNVDNEGSSVLHIAVRNCHKQILIFLCKTIINTFTFEEQRSLFGSCDKSNKNIFHLSKSNGLFTTLCDCLNQDYNQNNNNVFTLDEIEKLSK